MSNIGKKVRLKNYRGMLSDLNGKIATITKESNSVYSVLIDETGETCVPYKENTGKLSQCELLEEYSVEDVKNGKIAVQCPTEDIFRQVITILKLDWEDSKVPQYFKDDKENTTIYDCFGLGYADIETAKNDGKMIAKGEDFVEHNKHLLTKQQKEETMEKPQGIVIYGKEHQIKAIAEDLKEIGYTFYKSIDGYSCIISNMSGRQASWKQAPTKEQFSELYLNEKTIDESWKERERYHKRFQLPEQYSEALKFAKEQLEHPYWTQKPEKETITIGSRNTEVTVYKNALVEFVAEGNIRKDNVAVVQEIINSLGGDTDLQIARYGVHIDNSARFIRIGCEQENNLFSISELQKILDTYKELNE